MLEPVRGAGRQRARRRWTASRRTIALVEATRPRTCGRSARRAAEIRDDLRFLLQANDRDYVYYLEQRGRGVFLRASPIDVSSLVRNLLLDRFAAAVLTSATLAVEGSFAYVRSRLGVERARSSSWPSEFDFATQALLYLPKRMPSPKTADVRARPPAARVVEILRRTRGRAFVLFTSYADAARGAGDARGARSSTRCSSRAPRRGRRCCSSSGRRRTPCCWRPRASGRAWTWSATR